MFLTEQVLQFCLSRYLQTLEDIRERWSEDELGETRLTNSNKNIYLSSFLENPLSMLLVFVQL